MNKSKYMREIKFRAWNGNNMVDLYKTTPSVLIPDLKIDGLFIPFDKEWILMQFTGLKDRNDKEIYDGDVLSGGIYLTYLVQWNFKDNGWNISNNTSRFGIIGNIYENPELLK